MDVDPDALDAARKALGTRGVSETVNAALADAGRRVTISRFDVRDFDVTDQDIAVSRRDRLDDSGPS